MFIWQYIDIPQEEIETIQQKVRAKLPDNSEFFQPISIEQEFFLGLEIYIVVLIQAAPGFGLDNYGIHKDFDDTNQGRCLAINIPLDNCEESITKFWETDKPDNIQFTPNGMPYNLIEEKDCRYISEFKLTQPIIFNTCVPHNVVNPQKVWRRAISIRFKDDPWHLINI